MRKFHLQNCVFMITLCALGLSSSSASSSPSQDPADVPGRSQTQLEAVLGAFDGLLEQGATRLKIAHQQRDLALSLCLVPQVKAVELRARRVRELIAHFDAALPEVRQKNRKLVLEALHQAVRLATLSLSAAENCQDAKSMARPGAWRQLDIDPALGPDEIYGTTLFAPVSTDRARRPLGGSPYFAVPPQFSPLPNALPPMMILIL